MRIVAGAPHVVPVILIVAVIVDDATQPLENLPHGTLQAYPLHVLQVRSLAYLYNARSSQKIGERGPVPSACTVHATTVLLASDRLHYNTPHHTTLDVTTLNCS